jgi:hypothetical protein
MLPLIQISQITEEKNIFHLHTFSTKLLLVSEGRSHRILQLLPSRRLTYRPLCEFNGELLSARDIFRDRLGAYEPRALDVRGVQQLLVLASLDQDRLEPPCEHIRDLL